MEKKIATPKIAKAIWLKMERPNCTKVREKLIADGYAVPSHRTITKWQAKGGWPKTPRAEIVAEAAEKNGGPKVVEAKRAQKATLQAIAEALTGRKDASPEDLALLLTGKNADGSAAIPDKPVDQMTPEEQRRVEIKETFDGVKQRLAGLSDNEVLLEGVTAQGMRTAFVLFGLIETYGKEMFYEDPAAVGKAFESIAAGLIGVASPLDRVIALRASREKTIGVPQPNGSVAELLPPEEDDPLAASFKAQFAGNGA